MNLDSYFVVQLMADYNIMNNIHHENDIISDSANHTDTLIKIGCFNLKVESKQ